MIRNAWKEYIKIEQQELLTCGSNNTTSAYRHCGIYPFNTNYNGCNHVLSTLGELNKKLKRGSPNEEYKTIIRKGATVSNKEKNTHQRFEWHMGNCSSILTAYFRFCKLLGNWKDTIILSKDPSKTISPLTATTSKEIIAMIFLI